MISSDETQLFVYFDDVKGEIFPIDGGTDFSNGSVAVHFLFAGRARKRLISFERIDGSLQFFFLSKEN